MAMNDTLADMLARIRNAQLASLDQVKCYDSKLNKAVLAVLKDEGYIIDFSHEQVTGKAFSQLIVKLKYNGSKGAITMLKRISKAGRRSYVSAAELTTKKVCNGLGVAILSTNKGVMSDAEARRQHVGGELLCNVF